MSLSDRLRKFFVTNPAPRLMPRQPDAFGAQPTWFGPFIGPGTPITPVQGAVSPRYFDYIAGVNANVVPRTEYPNLPNFFQLWSAYESMPIMKVMVSFRIQEILSLDWKIKLRDGSGTRGTRGVDAARKLLEHPDPQMDYGFEQWMRSILEEVYVTDALSIYPVKNRLKRVIGFMQVDGQTIKPLIDYARGGIPVPPDPAFVQYIKGSAYTEFTSEQLIYRPFRPRVWCVYGRPRVENVLMTAVLYQLHENWASDYFTAGNLPEVAGIINPDFAQNMPPAKMKEWQQLMDEVSGINVGRRRVHIMPPFLKDVKALKEFSFERSLPDWMVRLLCIEFGVPSYLFTSETNRATAKEMNEVIHDTPLRVDLMSTKRLCDKLLEHAGYPEAEFEFQKQPDYSKEQVDGIVALTTPPPTGGQPIMSRVEARMYLGLSEEEELDEQAGSEDTEGGPDDATLPDAGALPPDPDADTADPAAPAAPGKMIGGVVKRFPAGAQITKARKPPAAGSKGSTAERARLAAGLADVVLKRMRQSQAKVMNEALARARARGKQIAAKQKE